MEPRFPSDRSSVIFHACAEWHCEQGEDPRDLKLCLPRDWNTLHAEMMAKLYLASKLNGGGQVNIDLRTTGLLQAFNLSKKSLSHPGGVNQPGVAQILLNDVELARSFLPGGRRYNDLFGRLKSLMAALLEHELNQKLFSADATSAAGLNLGSKDTLDVAKGDAFSSEFDSISAL